MSKQNLKQTLKENALNLLRGYLPPGSTVYTVCRNVSRSGMTRQIDCYAIVENRPFYLTGMISEALGIRRHASGPMIVGGCGMDIGFHVVHSLSYALHLHVSKGEGVKASERGIPFEPTKDNFRAGYSLKHEWI